jgi:hypothetical protein
MTDPHQAAFPAFLDPDETSVDSEALVPTHGLPLPSAADTADHEKQHIAFRHSGTFSRRQATRDVLLERDTPQSVMDRWDACGAAAWVLRSPTDPPTYAVATNRCRHRWCPACQADRRRALVRRLRDTLPRKPLRFVTLTMASMACPLADQLNRLTHCFRKLRQAPCWKRSVTGGIFFVEITRNLDTGLWHPHLHTLVSGTYLPQQQLKSAWLKITGDSYIVDVRFVANPNAAASYVAKYASKSCNASVWAEPAALSEAMDALANRRTFQTFGSWRDLDLSRPPEPLEGWEAIAPLWKILEEARRGVPSALHILNHIGGSEDGLTHNSLGPAP